MLFSLGAAIQTSKNSIGRNSLSANGLPYLRFVILNINVIQAELSLLNAIEEEPLTRVWMAVQKLGHCDFLNLFLQTPGRRYFASSSSSIRQSLEFFLSF